MVVNKQRTSTKPARRNDDDYADDEGQASGEYPISACNSVLWYSQLDTMMTVRGLIVSDPEFSYTDKGVAMCRFRLSQRQRSRGQEKVYITHDVVFFGVPAEEVNAHAQKNMVCAVAGEGSGINTYTGKDGNVYASYQLRGVLFFRGEVIELSNNGNGRSSGSSNGNGSRPQRSAPPARSTRHTSEPEYDDEAEYEDDEGYADDGEEEEAKPAPRRAAPPAPRAGSGVPPARRQRRL